MFKSIASTSTIKKSRLDEISKELKDLNIDAVTISVEKIGFMLDMFKRKYRYSMTTPVVAAVMNGDVVPVFTKSTTITTYMPTFMKKHNGKISNFVNLSVTNAIRLTESGDLSGSERAIFSLLQFGYIVERCYFKYDRVKNDAILHNLTSMAYGKLFGKVLNKMFSTAHYPELHAKILFLGMKFYYINMLEQGGGERLNSNLFVNTNKLMDTKIAESRMGNVFDVPDSAFSSLDTLLVEIAKLEPVVSKVSLSTFNSNWVLLFGAMSFFASEHPVYLWANIATAVIGTSLNSGYENVLGDLTVDVYDRLAVAIR